MTQEQILDALRTVIDPDFRKDLVTLGMIKDLKVEGNDVAFTVELTTPACPLREKIESDCYAAIGRIPGIGKATITMSARVRPQQARGVEQLTLPGVKNVIAIASGKGGVGKSTVSANVACALAQMGATVGLLDADIYGPSIPLIMGVEDAEPKVDDARQQLLPIERYGVKMISMGFLQRSTAAVIWRGPMVSKAVQQFLRDVYWGEIDYLVVDLPPGTGDAQLTLSQAIPLTGAAIVMTPQDVAAAVAVKAISMFRRLDVPILGIVENMSYFICPSCSSRHDIFAHGGGKQAAEALEAPFLGEVPLHAQIRIEADEGTPTVVASPDSEEAQAFRRIAEAIAQQVSIVVGRGPIPLKMAPPEPKDTP
ncbi:MAG TPA: iron-sulfur cluster carrier protein ApbC [Capsulimonadaceae bacterium]|nr:iron-sulfur cluster carrier protein ApbC [Capsulimonadaceae bacterium]